jgi:hypothetical protein
MIEEQQTQIEAQQQEIEKLKEERLTVRSFLEPKI